MFFAEYKGINDFLVKSAQLLLEFSVKRNTRGYTCYELPEPFIFKISNPLSRWVTVPERKWNHFLPYAESLWIASGRNDMEYITRYLKHMVDFSDDGTSMRGGYGPRMRYFNGSYEDYYVSLTEKPTDNYVDQYRYVVECFAEDINTRRAVVNLDDTNKDEFDASGKLKKSKDIPCTRLLHFQKDPTENKLNLTVFMRSNDYLWGASAVNIFNYTFIQEYFAAILGLEVGSYFHIADNFHFYSDKKQVVEAIAEVSDYKDPYFLYDKSFTTLQEFDNSVRLLENEEVYMTQDDYKYKPELFEDPFFKDWYGMLVCKFHKEPEIRFINPILNSLI